MNYRTHDSGKRLRGPHECPHLMTIEVILPVVMAICCRLADLCWGDGVTVVMLYNAVGKNKPAYSAVFCLFPKWGGGYVSCPFFIDNAHYPIMIVLPGQLYWPSWAGGAPCSYNISPYSLGLLLWMGAFWRKLSEHQFPPMKCPFIWSSHIGPSLTGNYLFTSCSDIVIYQHGTPQSGRGCCYFSSGKTSLQVWEGNRKSSWG